MKSASEVIQAIHGARATGKKAGLRNTRALLDTLGCPAPQVLVQVAGTNGKGSTCAMVESILRTAGMKTGLYSSPYLQSYHERIRIDGVPISDERLAEAGEQVLSAADGLACQGIHCEPFELGTALAMLVFAREQVDAAVVEVGLGGRLDPTNALPATLCGIAAIGMDHMAILGDTLTAIAGEKAGIMKPGVPVIAGINPPEVTQVFRDHAQTVGAPLTQLVPEMILQETSMRRGNEADFQLNNRWRQLHIPLPGAHQVQNALLALALAEALMAQGVLISTADVARGIARTGWPGRMEWVENVLLDGAHNAHGMGALNRFVKSFLNGTRCVLLVGMLEEKDTPAMEQELLLLCRHAAGVVTVTPDHLKALPGSALCAWISNNGIMAEYADHLADGLQQARTMAGENGVVIAAGSLYLIGELRTLLGLPWR